MGYQALLFCPDEKTARTVTQVLSELDFAVEPCTEPFVAVKKLMAQHFDAIVVDCDNEQNATLLFKSAHGSASNQTSLAVAVVEAQAGVAKAFRIGANLVLTKPINVEQAKGTLRVARGLLRKGEPAKPVSQAVPPRTDMPRPMAPPAPVIVPAASAPAWPQGQASIATNSFSPTAKSDAVDPDNDVLGDDAESFTQSPVFNPAPPAATAPKKAATPVTVAAKPAKTAPGTIMLSANPPASSAARAYSSPSASASAPAPAREHPDDAASAPAPTRVGFGREFYSGQNPLLSDNPLADIAASPPVPLFTFGNVNESAETSSGGSKKIFAAVAVLVVAAVGSYFAWTQFHKKSDLSLADAKPAAAVEPASHLEPAASKAQRSMTESTPTSAPIATNPQPKASAATTESKPQSFERDVFDYANFDNKSSDSKSSGNKTSASKSPKPSALTSSPDIESAATAKPAAAPIVVRNSASEATLRKPAPDVPAPSPVEIAPTTSGGSLPNILGNGGNVPKPVLQTLNISQGVSQGLLIKKVQPVYPANALRMHVEGAVELQATIGKSGNIVTVKALTGDSVLARAAKEAVLQWKYKPYLLNGEPVEIQTQITVNFKLPK